MADRLDIVLVNRGFAKSREKAKELVKDGKVYINNVMQTKPSSSIDDAAEIEIRGELCRYVSRGGYKLEKALSSFDLDVTGLNCMDIGASTGGFTDCLLQFGASFVIALDVGHDQLDESLLEDRRVLSLEGINFKNLTKDDFMELVTHSSDLINTNIDLAVCDVSFISLKHILPNAFDFLSENGEMVCLIKPQFEAGREHLNKKGVVKDKKIHVNVIRDIIELAKATGFYVRNLTFSPIKGPEGNIEYLLYLSKDISKDGVFVNATNTVNEAFDE